MTLFTRFPLRLTIPLFLLLLALLAEGYTMWYSRARADADEEKRLLEQVGRTMIELQASVNYRLRKEDLEGAQSAIAIRGANTAIDVIALVDDTGTIIGSTNLKIVGTPASMALPEADTANMRKAGTTLTGSVVISDDRMILTAYYPAILGVRAGEIRPRRIGTLYLRYNMAAAKAMRRRDLERHTLVVAGFYAGCFLALGLFLHAVLTSRVNRLVAASERLTSGDLSLRAGIKGNDELAQIGVAFDSMVRRILSEQESLRRSEERYRMLFENSPLSIWEEDFSGVKALFDDLRRKGVADLETYFAQYPETVRQCAELVRIIDLNRAALELHGAASKKELLAGLLNTFTPESFDTFRQELVCLWNGGMEMATDGVVRTLEGESRQVMIYFAVSPGHEATFSKVLVSLVDITKRKRAEEALKASESRLNEAQRIAHIGSWELDLLTNTLSWTDEIYRIFEIDPERFGASYEAFLDSIHPDDREMVNAAYTGSLRDRTPYEIVHRLLMADGRIKYVGERCETSFRADGTPLRSLGTVQDITSQREAEEVLSLELSINKALSELAASLLAEASLEEMANLTLSFARSLTSSRHGYVSVIDPVTKENIGYTLTKMMRDTCKVEDDKMKIRFPVGEDGKYPLLWGCSLNERKPMYTNNPSEHPESKGIPSGHVPLDNFLAAPAIYAGELVGQIALANSEHAYTDKDLDIVVRLANLFAIAIHKTRAEEKILKSLKEKEVLLAEVHHRVKNNMAVISSLLRMQSTYIKDKEYVEMFRECQNRIRSMALVHEKLYKTRDFANINIRDYLVALSSGIKETFSAERHVEVSVEAEDLDINIDILIPCGLIINELLTNSFKHAFVSVTEPRISITLETQDDNYLLTIADNGIGLPEGFDITQPEGLGFKLVTALCQQIKGSLSHEQDGGTTFKLSFPGKLKFTRG